MIDRNTTKLVESESERPSMARQPKPLVAVVRVTSRCAMACQYCGFSRAIQRDRVDIDGQALRRFGRGLAEYQTLTPRMILISWLGGEPYAWPDLWSISREFRDFDSMRLGVTTAGTALASHIVRQRTIECFDEVTLSVDGLEEDHDTVRQSPGSYARLRESCLRLRDEDRDGNLKLRVNMVLMRGNIMHFADACRELATWGVDEISFNQLGGNDRPEFYPAHRLCGQQFTDFVSQLPQLRRELAEQGVMIAGGPEYLERIAATIAGRALPILDCQPAAQFLFVDELGRVSPCSFTSHCYAVSMHQLQTGQAIAGLPALLAEQQATHICQACSDCHATHQFDKFAAIAGSVQRSLSHR